MTQTIACIVMLIWQPIRQAIDWVAGQINRAGTFIATPPLLRRIDYWLLLNRPLIWSTRIHIIVWRSLLALIGLCIPGSIIIIPLGAGLAIWFFVTIVISFQCGVLTRWIRASRTVEREYGDTSPWRVYIELALITICTSIMFLPSLALIEVLKINAASQYDSQQMTVDINTVDEVVSSRLNQLKTEYPQFVQDETTNLSDCEQVIEYTKALIAVDATFFDKLAMSGESLKAYDDRILNHIENIDQLKNYCSTLSLVHSTRDFAFSHSGLGEVFFYGMHIVIVFSGWFWVNARYYPLRVFASLSIIIIIGITIVSIAAIVAFGFPLLSDWILRRPFREVSVSHFLNVLAVTTTLATAVSLQVIFSINERQIYSREKAYLITALPLLLCAAVILVNVAFVRSIIIVGMSTLGLAIALFLLLPALKNQQNKLYSLPEE